MQRWYLSNSICAVAASFHLQLRFPVLVECGLFWWFPANFFSQFLPSDSTSLELCFSKDLFMRVLVKDAVEVLAWLLI